MKKIHINFLLSALLSSFATAEEAPSKDREAIKAMAGEYKIQFDYRETIAIQPDYIPKERYSPEAAEYVTVVEDNEREISLQHILIDDKSGRIIKHWKQLWTYEDTEIMEFKGEQTWTLNSISPEEAKGTWSQRVYQVDDSPRYEVYGKWQHEGGVSRWTSTATRRPLPRREETSRDDYAVMISGHRITITPVGWVHEQDNIKQVSPGGPIICLEDGLNHYTKTKDVDFSEAIDYWKSTAAFWTIVSEKFDKGLETRKLTIRSDKDVNGAALYKQIFRLTQETAKGGKSLEGATLALDEVLSKFLVPATKTANN